jgi:PadR family transcriptional regulator PadR
MDSPITAEAAILAVLFVRKRSFGLEIIDAVREQTKGLVKLNEGAVYPKLRAMEADGLLRAFNGEGPPSRGGRPRRYYELTAEGLRIARAQHEGLKGLLRKVPS